MAHLLSSHWPVEIQPSRKSWSDPQLSTSRHAGCARSGRRGGGRGLAQAPSALEPLPAARPGERRSGVRGRSRVPTLDPPALHSPPRWGLRSPRPQGARPGLSRRGRGAFRSPRPSPQAAQAGGGSRGSLCLDVERLREERDALEREIAGLLSDGICVEELDEHISRLHEYNDLKDVGQMLLGKLAVLRGVTTKELYAEFDLDLND